MEANKSTHKSYTSKKNKLSEFFSRHWAEYMKKPTRYVEPHQLKAVNAMLSCRSSIRGVDLYACPSCSEITEVRHPCNHRFCTSCSWSDTLKWADKLSEKLLPVTHRHAVCTVPHQLIPLFKSNERTLYSLLMRTSANVFQSWFEHKFSIKTGIVCVLHTFGEKKNYHPHTHLLLPWAGKDIETGKYTALESEYIQYKGLRNRFRWLFEKELIHLFDSGELEHNFSSRQEFMQFLKKINKDTWTVHIERGVEDTKKIVRYIGRYSKRACLSEHKIESTQGEYISFRYKDYRDRDLTNNKAKEKVMRLHYSKFFPRLLQHVPLPYFSLVRYYGLYSSASIITKEFVIEIDSINRKNEEKKDVVPVSEKKSDFNEATSPLICTCCNCKKVYLYTWITYKKTLQTKDIDGLEWEKLRKSFHRKQSA